MSTKANSLLILVLVFSLALYTNSTSLRNKNLKGATLDSPVEPLNLLQTTGDLSYLKNPTFLAVGYNLFLGNPKMTPSSGKLVDPGFASDIFKLTYGQNQVTGDKSFAYPDGFALQLTQICQANFSSQTIRTKTDIQKSMAASLGVSGSYGVYAGSLNVDYNEMSKSISENDKMYIMNEAECSIYKTHVKQYGPPELADDFLNGLKTIDGKTWESGNKEYRAFIESFGTHYIKDALMGSRYTYILETSNSKYTQMLDKGVNIAAEASYSAVASLSVSSSLKTSSASHDEFEKNMSNKFVTSLGAPMPGNLEMESWFEQTKDEPMPISYTISPITQLLNMPTTKDRLRAAGLNPEGLVSGLDNAVLSIQKEIGASPSSPSTPAAVGTSIKVYNTAFDDDGAGSVFFLDRHNLMCNDYEAINSFRLVRGGSTIKYEYKCVKSDTVSKVCTEFNTDPQEALGVNYLDRHTVNCPSGVLKGFQLLRNGNKMYYKYKCCNFTTGAANCNKIETAKTSSGDFKTFYLDRQQIDVPANRAISNFKLVSDGTNFSYSLTVCDVSSSGYTPTDSVTVAPEVVTVSVRQTNNAWNDSGAGNIFFLDRQDVACAANEGISQFVMAREGNNIRYNYSCSKSSKITTNCQTKTTPQNDTDSNSYSSGHYLDRHDMNCGANWVIQRFKLERNGGKIFYTYNCCQTTNTGMCNAKTTAPSSNGNKETFYLDRQNVVAGPNTAVSRIKLNTEGANYTYSFSDCPLN